MSKVIKADICHEINLCKVAVPQQENGQMEDEGDADDTFSPFYRLAGAERDTSNQEVESDGNVSPIDRYESTGLDASKDIIIEARLRADALKKEAEAILENARKIAAKIEAEAYDQGYAQGRKDGEAFGRKQYETRCSRLKDVINAIQLQGDAIVSRYEQQLVRLCMEISRHIVHHEIEIMPETIILSIKEAMKQVVEGSQLNIRLNPRDVELVNDFVEKEIRVTGGHPVNITPDSRISAGGCIIETDFGLIDATVDGKWQAVSDAIKKVLYDRSKGDGRAD